MQVRDATPADLPAVLAIHNDVVATSTAIFTEQPDTLADRVAWFERRRALGYPVLVADLDGSVAGFASFGPFRDWPGFATTVEHSIHVAAAGRGRGVGSALLTELVDRATALERHVMVAAVDAANDGSLRLHERFGFTEVARMPEVARKFDHWLDLVLLQRVL